MGKTLRTRRKENETPADKALLLNDCPGSFHFLTQSFQPVLKTLLKCLSLRSSSTQQNVELSPSLGSESLPPNTHPAPIRPSTLNVQTFEDSESHVYTHV